MIQAMYNGVSGLKAHKTEMDVISNNIANVNTVGFKSSSITFREMLSQTMRGASAPTTGGSGGTNPMQIGLGTGVGNIDTNLTQGSLLPTGKSTDVAIEGNGYLMVGDGTGKYYTRDGNFQVDAAGNLVSSASGMKVLGWMANPTTGAIDTTSTITAATGITLPLGQLAIARETGNVTYGGNLNADSSTGDHYGVSVNIYDSLGVSHELSITFTKKANTVGGQSDWTWTAASPDAAASTTVGTGTVSFDSNGKCITPNGNITLDLANGDGAGDPITASLSFSAMRQLSGETTVSATSQDGLPLGMLDSFSISKNGVISGAFTNGMSQPLAQLALAQFTNPAGLSKAGNNMLLETSNSGLPQVGQPSVGSLGNITAGFLESSNVDLPTEFANMIVAQRGFQANSRIITTSDEILQELVQLKR